MKLREMSPDQILEQLELRSDKLLAAEELAGVLEASLKAWEASGAIAIRDTGKSMSEAESRVRANPDWAELYRELQTANVKAAAAKRDYQRAVIASDLYRTEMASLRNVR